MVLVDTSVWVDFLNGTSSPEAKALANLIASDATVAINGVVLTEILLGLKNDREAEKIQDLLAAFDYLPELSRQDHELAAKIYRDCRARGLTVRSTIDCLIAQTCIARNLGLLTKDRDFKAIAKVVPALTLLS